VETVWGRVLIVSHATPLMKTEAPEDSSRVMRMTLAGATLRRWPYLFRNSGAWFFENPLSAPAAGREQAWREQAHNPFADSRPRQPDHAAK
jgi:hypothetical protein